MRIEFEINIDKIKRVWEVVSKIAIYIVLVIFFTAFYTVMLVFLGGYITWNPDFTLYPPYSQYLFRAMVLPSLYSAYWFMKKEED